MGMEWTEEQKQVITLRGKNLLVSAAAGSGKTAVLVERVIGRILDGAHPVDIDRILIVTFTSAAAAEMRERIGNAVEAALERDPADGHLMKQASLVHHAQITTIHSFCLYLIRNYFHLVDLEPNFRIAEEGELNLLKEDVIDEVLTRNYEEGEAGFLQFVECFATGKKDDGLKDMVLGLYTFAMSFPWPKEWLYEAAQNYQAKSISDMEKTPWMQALLCYVKRICRSLIELAKKNEALTQQADGPVYLNETAAQDLGQILDLSAAGTYRELAQKLNAYSFGRLPVNRKYEGSEEKRDLFKEQREQLKSTVKKLKADYASANEEELILRMSGMGPVAKELARLAEEFLDAYDTRKRKENILDFDDLEHFALKILLDETTKQPTEIARLCRKFYEEVMVDEYQDSNLVQESLLLAVSGEQDGKYNRFMVGDVKQSIYRFRLARPELFMEKYQAYTADGNQQRKVELRKNFRSRSEVLDFTNNIFFQIMKKDLGNVEYDSAAALYPGALYPECSGMQAEFILADPADEMLLEAELSDPIRLEAELVAARIRKMMRGQKVADGASGTLRPVRYADIVILLRSFTGYVEPFLEVLEQKGIPAHATSKTGYFKAQEVATVLSALRVLDNPRQDIPLAATLRSPIGGFLDEELAAIKAAGGEKPFHACVLDVQEGELPEGLYQKLKVFLKDLKRYRALAEELGVYELLHQILQETGFLDYAAAMPGGSRRQANLEMLLEKAAAYEKSSYHGLYHFIRYMDKLQKYEVDYGEAEVVGENSDAVRIMTIHKSKGLEFPVVFVCGTAKRFNRMDARSRMVIHPDLGIGMDYIDPVRRVRSATLCKKAVAKQIELENEGEELRVLYVALTRAKEKLVLTGVEKGITERLRKNPDMSFLARATANSFLDWLLPAMLSAGEQDLIQVWGAKELVEDEVESRLLETKGLGELLYRASQTDEEADAYVEEKLSYCYPDAAETSRRTKYAVSELKSRRWEAFNETKGQKAQDMDPVSEADGFVPYVPRFAGGESEENQGVLRGNAMHRAMACLPVQVLAGHPQISRELERQIDVITAKGRLTEEMRMLLNKKRLEAFFVSGLALRMKAAAERGELYLEQPFVMGRPADEIEGDGSSTMVLVQGIMDAFFIEGGELVLVDYKTDAVNSEEELAGRYRGQMDWYKKALMANTGKRVKEQILYSFYLGREVLLAPAHDPMHPAEYGDKAGLI